MEKKIRTKAEALAESMTEHVALIAVPPRDQIVDIVRCWSEKTEIRALHFIGWVDTTASVRRSDVECRDFLSALEASTGKKAVNAHKVAIEFVPRAVEVFGAQAQFLGSGMGQSAAYTPTVPSSDPPPQTKSTPPPLESPRPHPPPVAIRE